MWVYIEKVLYLHNKKCHFMRRKVALFVRKEGNFHFGIENIFLLSELNSFHSVLDLSLSVGSEVETWLRWLVVAYILRSYAYAIWNVFHE